MPDFTDFDFGITGLAATYFHADWTHDGTRFDVLNKAIGDGMDSRSVKALRRDARLMRDGLSSDSVGTLWDVGAAWFGIEDGPGVAHQWMDEILDFCDAWLSRNAGTQSADYFPEDGQQSADAVLHLIASVAGLPAQMATALSDCVRCCTPDLALRWLIRALQNASDRILTEDQYTELSRLAEKFGYGEFVMPSMSGLVAE